jgi:transposase
MPVPRACPIRATPQRRVLKRRVRGHKTPHRDRVRAQIVLDAAAGHANAVIARRCSVGVDTVRTWRGRFAAEGLDGLKDRPRSGRPARFTPVQVAEIKALACQLPAQAGAPLSRWSSGELARHAIQAGIVQAISASTMRRWLRSDAIKPWQYRSWIFPRDPGFATKAARVLDLYAGVYEGQPLGTGEYVISSDEKTSIQARCRCHPPHPATRHSPRNARQPRLRPRRGTGLLGRLRRAPRPPARPLTRIDQHQQNNDLALAA